jgi:hypothetical protein
MKAVKRYPTSERPSSFDPANTQTDKVKLFSAHVLEQSDVRAYLRTGGCTVGCGACCEAVVLPVDSTKDFSTQKGLLRFAVPLGIAKRPGFADWEHWLTLHDITLFAEAGKLVAEVPTPDIEWPDAETAIKALGGSLIERNGQLLLHLRIRCGELTEDKQCGVRGTSAHPQMCQDYPRHPTDIEGFDFCTYNFIPLTEIQLQNAQRAAIASKPRSSKRRKR